MLIIFHHADNCKNKFLVLGEGPNDDFNGSVDAAEEKFSINFSKTKTKFAWVYISITIVIICLLTENKSTSLKSIIKVSTFWLNFV